MIRTAELRNVPTIVKLATWNPLFARDALDNGAFGIQVPFVDSAQMLREVILACRYKPVGTRGFCSASRGAGYGVQTSERDKFLAFQTQVLIIPMIESPEAVENLDEMLETSPEVEVYSVGPDDLRLALEVPSDAEGWKYMDKVVQSIARKVHKAGKLVMLPMAGPDRSYTPEVLAEDMELMHNDFPYTVDSVCLAFGLEEALRARTAARAKKRDAG
jgi:2-keto-3-deoxy-L-rhamnonate aldolase RhmA